MNENFLSYVWKYQLFDFFDLKTSDGSKLSVYSAGKSERHSGPDYFNARISIDGVTWAGNVEIHTASSSWNHHRHQCNPAFNTVILQVVFTHDIEVRDLTGRIVPCLELKQRISPELFELSQRYETGSQAGPNWIPCEKLLTKVHPNVLSGWLDLLGHERVDMKMSALSALHSDELKRDPLSLLMQLLVRGFATPPNSFVFKWLSSAVDLPLIRKYRGDPLMIEALLQGQAGFLDEANEDLFHTTLRKMFGEEQHHLSRLNAAAWRFFRTYPANSPQVRLSQLAALLAQSETLCQSLLALPSVSEIKKLLRVKAATYWETRFRFGRLTQTARERWIGRSMLQTLLVNSVSLFYIVLSKNGFGEPYLKRGLEIQKMLTPERNNVVNQFKNAGLSASNSWETQALLQLKTYYCEERKCLICRIGQALLTGTNG